MEDHSEHASGRGGSIDEPRGFGPNGHAVPGGLSLVANGLRLVPATTRFDAGTAREWTFRIVREDGSVVTAFDETHGERSHLIVVRRDLTHFQHLHPSLEQDGTWRVDHLGLSEPGAYRAFVDVVVDGRPTTLGFDLFAAGTWDVAAPPGSSRETTVDGYDAQFLTDHVTPGERTTLTFAIHHDGEPVSDIEEYLGARGHLVALRAGDLAYIHVHPERTPTESDRIEFGAVFPTPGRYRLFLQAKPNGTLVTAPFDLTLGS